MPKRSIFPYRSKVIPPQAVHS